MNFIFGFPIASVLFINFFIVFHNKADLKISIIISLILLFVLWSLSSKVNIQIAISDLPVSRPHSFPYLLIHWIRQRFKVNVWVNPPAASNFMAQKIASSTPAIDTGFGNIKFGSKLFWS